MPFKRMHIDFLHLLEQKDTRFETVSHIAALFPMYSLMRMFHPFLLMRLEKRHPSNYQALKRLILKHRETWPKLEPDMTQSEFTRLRDWLMSLDFSRVSVSDICISAPATLLSETSGPFHKPSIDDARAHLRWEEDLKQLSKELWKEQAQAQESESLALALSLEDQGEEEATGGERKGGDSGPETRVIPVSGRTMQIIRDDSAIDLTRDEKSASAVEGPRRCPMCSWSLQYRGQRDGQHVYSCKNFKSCSENGKLVA